MKRNILIDILLFGNERLCETKDFERKDLINELVRLKYNSVNAEFAVDAYLDANFETTDSLDVSDSVTYRINSDGLARLMTYQSLELTNESVRKARNSVRIAIGSIILAILTSGISIWLSIYSTYFKQDIVSLTPRQEKEFMDQNRVIVHSLEKVLYQDSVNLALFRATKSKIEHSGKVAADKP